MADNSSPRSDPSEPDGPGGGYRRDAGLAMIVAGGACVVIGGLVAAITGPLDFSHGSWLAAYLVLVGGAAQYAMGRVRGWRVEADRSPSRAWAQFGGWNLGNAFVIAGTLVSAPLVVDAGSLLLVFALLVAFRAALPARGTSASPLLIWTYRILLLVLIVSIPVGMVLSHLRNT